MPNQWMEQAKSKGFSAEEKATVRELAARYMDLALLPVNGQRIARMKKSNGLTPGRPIVWLHEIPWNEMNIGDELTITSRHSFARAVEDYLRTSLYRWKHIQADTVLLPYYSIKKSFSSSGIGIDVREETIVKDKTNRIISHKYEDQLDTLEKVEALKRPTITAHPERDEINLEMARELLGDTIPVKLLGHGVYYAPWDDISRMRGVEPLLIDLWDRPELMHRTIERFSGFAASRFTQMEALGLLEWNVPDLHCTPPYVDDLPSKEFDGIHSQKKDVWFRGTAQLFGSISPEMHEEFDLAYTQPLMEQFGLGYYGCCEPLDHVIFKLMKFQNLRKVGVPPWANVSRCAEMLGGRYVVARKPNPAFVAGTFNEEAVRNETAETVEACLRYGCAYELVLKDISTVSYRPQNLMQWVRVVNEVLDQYYGAGA